jgi:hypothetical protein
MLVEIRIQRFNPEHDARPRWASYQVTIEPTDRVSTETLMEWAVIEPDETLMRSTRRAGAPITWAKRMLLRAMQQHFNELTSQQTRFNLHVLVHVAELEDRIRDLEADLEASRSDEPTDRQA